jgi:hypothetical protein
MLFNGPNRPDVEQRRFAEAQPPDLHWSFSDGSDPFLDGTVRASGSGRAAHDQNLLTTVVNGESSWDC